MPTILELFKSRGLDKSVKAEKETLIEQETSGIRVKSAVELNNPLLYGNEAIRIVNRSTSTLESMKGATGGQEGDGGLIGQGLSKVTDGKVGSITQARDAVNSKLGIPITPNPSRLVGEIEKISTSDPITKDNVGNALQGTGLGQFLKDTGGGDPKTLGKQALGAGIGLAKDKVRGKLFGSQQTIGDVIGEPTELNYSDTNPYTKVLQDNRDYKNEGGVVGNEDLGFEDEFKGIDLKLVSPIHGVRRVGKATEGTFDGRFGKTEYAFQSDNSFNAGVRYTPESQQNYTQVNGYESSLIVKRGFGSKRGDKITLNPRSYDELDLKTGKMKIGSDEYVDLVPLWIGYYGSSKPVLFRAAISGLTENVSPSWSSNNFVGNPYKYYIYESIERNVTFNMNLYCNNPLELSANWERVTELTKMAYPSITDNLANPPFIWFKLGDIYTKKAGIIESLTYTMPDNGTWETEQDGFILPKFIDVAITIKFIENVGDGIKANLYNYKKSKDALKKATEEKQQQGVVELEGDSINTPPSTTLDSDTSKLDNQGNNIDIQSISKSKGIKNLQTGKNDTKPKDDVSQDPILAQSATNDALGGKSVEESVKEAEQTVLPEQSIALVSLTSQGYKRVPKSDNQLQGEIIFAVGDKRNMIGMEKDGENKFAVIFGDGVVVIRNYRNK